MEEIAGTSIDMEASGWMAYTTRKKSSLSFP
jgi:hypothetical protein